VLCGWRRAVFAPHSSVDHYDLIAAKRQRSREDWRMRTNRFSPQGRAADLAARDRAVMQDIEKEQKARDKKTARLRALRLAKEAADKERSEKEEAERLAAAEQTLKPSGSKPTRPRKRSAAGKDEATDRPVHHG
jgi:hypothetical protein